MLTMLQLVITLLILYSSVTEAWDFGCDTMDIATDAPPLPVSSFPYDIQCSLLQDGDIAVVISSPEAPPYTGIMLQVQKDWRPVGTFRTKGTTSDNRNAVGTDYEVACGETNYAQVSVDKRPKQQMEGRWFNLGRDDMDNADVQCVVTIIQTDERNRWVRVATPLNRNQAPARPTANMVPQRVFSPTQPRILPPTQPPTTLPPTTTTERDWNAGKIRVGGTVYPRHCVDEMSYGRVPLYHTGCSQYIAVRRGLARAIHTCPTSAGCFDTFSCSCRECSRVFCASHPIEPDTLIEIFDSSDIKTGEILRQQKRQPGLTSGFNLNTERQGNLNPSNIPDRPVYWDSIPAKVNRGRKNNRKGSNRQPSTINAFNGILSFLGNLGL